MTEIFKNKETQKFYVVANTLFLLSDLVAETLTAEAIDPALVKSLAMAFVLRLDQPLPTKPLPSLVANWRCEMESGEQMLHLCLHRGHLSASTSWEDIPDRVDPLLEVDLVEIEDEDAREEGEEKMGFYGTPLVVRSLVAGARKLKDYSIRLVPIPPFSASDRTMKELESRNFIV